LTCCTLSSNVLMIPRPPRPADNSMDKVAFARAARFLNYLSVAKWLALGCGMATAVLYVALLLVLSLFADLMVNRGEIPALHNLPTRGYTSALASMSLPEDDKDRKTTIGGWQKSLKDLGVDDQRLADLLAESSPKLERDAELRQHLIWFLQLPKLIEDNVGPSAAEAVGAAVKGNIQ